MALNAKTAPRMGGDFVEQPALDAGQYPARVVQVIDMGLQPQRAFQGKEKPPAHQIMITYELSHEFMVDEHGNPIAEKPRWYSEDFVFHNIGAEKAKSTIRYYAIDPKGVADGDFSKLVGMPCQVMLTKVPDKKNPGKEKNYVGDVSAAARMPGYVQPELVNPSSTFSMDEPDLEVFKKLPEWIQKRLKENLEYVGSPLDKLLSGSNIGAPSPKPAPSPIPAPRPHAPVPPAPPQK